MPCEVLEMKRPLVFVICASLSLAAFSQSADPVPLTQGEAIDFLKGKTLSSTRVAGGSPQIQFKDDGAMYGSSGGSSDSGKWRVEDNKLCMTWRKWEYEGCGLLVRVGAEIQHLYPNGKTHLIFKP